MVREEGHGQCLCRRWDVMVFGIEKMRGAVIKRQTKQWVGPRAMETEHPKINFGFGA